MLPMGSPRPVSPFQLLTTCPQLSRLEARDKELDVLFKRIYEDSALGNLSQERMLKLAAEYEDEQNALDTQIATVRSNLDELSGHEADLTIFMELIRKHSRIRKLTPEILHNFIDHITVYQAQKNDRRWQQRTDVFYNCVGDFRVPGQETPAKNQDTTLLTRKGVTISHAL